MELISAWEKVLEKVPALSQYQIYKFEKTPDEAIYDMGDNMLSTSQCATLLDAIHLYAPETDTVYYNFDVLRVIAETFGADVERMLHNGMNHTALVNPDHSLGEISAYEEVLNTIAEKMCDLSDIEAARKALTDTYLNETSYDFLDQMQEYDLLTDRERSTLDDYVRVYEKGADYNEIDVDKMQEVLDVLGITKEYVQDYLNEDREM